MSSNGKTRPILYQYFEDSSNVLLAEYQRSIQQKASNNLGSNREFFCNNFLSKVLPLKLFIGSGEIWDSNKQKTGQLDTIIIREDAPKLTFGNRDTYLAEGVFAVIEIKSNLTRQKLNEAGNQLEKIKSLKIGGGALISSGPVIDRPLRIVFSYQSANWDTLMDEIQKQNWQDLFDLICVLDKGVLIRKGFLISSSGEHPFLLINGKAASLGILYYYLISYSCSFLGRSLDINNYFEPINNWNP